MLDANDLYGNNLLSKLAENKVILLPIYALEIANYLCNSYQQCMMKDEVEYQNQVLGWYQYQGNDYYFFDETYFANKYATSAREEFLFQKGSREVYMDFLRNTIFPSVELSLALSIGYSAVVVPRLKFLNDLGTLIVNVSGISSTGKSTAEMLMCSPFMYPDINDGTKGLNLSANTTLNAIMSTIEGVFGVPFVVDDIKTNPDINLFQYIYNIAACNQKSRCNSEGKKRKKGLGWSGVMITSSEIPIVESTTQFQGLRVRVLHTDGIQWTKDAKQAEYIKETLNENYGFTGKEFADYVATIPLHELKSQFNESKKFVELKMIKTDGLTSRIANKFAVIHLTIKLLNEAFAYGLSEDELTARFIKCEQDRFDERDDAKNALECIKDFIVQHESRFDIESSLDSIHYYNESYATGEHYGKIFKYDWGWEVHLLTKKTDKILKDNEFMEERSIRRKWSEHGITFGDGDHTTKKFTHNSELGRVRYDCFIFEGGLKKPMAITPKVKGKTEENNAEVVEQTTPVSDYTVDDSAALEAIFRGEDNE